MAQNTTRFTAALLTEYINELKELAKEQTVPSVNYAINEAICEYLRARKTAKYKALLKEAGRDTAFLSRTLASDADFRDVDGEVAGSW